MRQRSLVIMAYSNVTYHKLESRRCLFAKCLTFIGAYATFFAHECHCLLGLQRRVIHAQFHCVYACFINLKLTDKLTVHNPVRE